MSRYLDLFGLTVPIVDWPKSEDGGKTWNKILFINERTGVADVCFNPQNPQILYATTWEFRRTPYSFNSGGKGSGLYKKHRWGKKLEKITAGLPQSDYGRIALSISPSAPHQLIAIVEAESTGFYISAWWRRTLKKSKRHNRCDRTSVLLFYNCDWALKIPNRVYRPAFTLSYSDDGGYSFNEVSGDGGWVHSDHRFTDRSGITPITCTWVHRRRCLHKQWSRCYIYFLCKSACWPILSCRGW